jgi:hypothetical protein
MVKECRETASSSNDARNVPADTDETRDKSRKAKRVKLNVRDVLFLGPRKVEKMREIEELKWGKPNGTSKCHEGYFIVQGFTTDGVAVADVMQDGNPSQKWGHIIPNELLIEFRKVEKLTGIPAKEVKEGTIFPKLDRSYTEYRRARTSIARCTQS